jgi:hypothetical protein
VWDESKLRNTRTCVSWVSPNYWVNGSIYGNIRFDFDWKELIEGKRFYWVEAMKRYSPPAYRILVSDRDHTGLRVYDPKLGNGPVFYDSQADTWYRNGDFTGEFLIDRDLWLPECHGAGLVDHHPSMCKRARSHCSHLAKPAAEAGAELLARLVGHNILQHKELFLDTSSKRRRLHDEAAVAWAHLKRSLKVRRGSSGRINHKHLSAVALVSSILCRFGLRHPKGTARLCDLFASTHELKLALTRRMVRAFDLPSADGLGEN